MPYQFELPEPATAFMRAPPSLSEDQMYMLSLVRDTRRAHSNSSEERLTLFAAAL